MTRVEFITKYYPLVKSLQAQTGIFPQTIFAQAILESSNSKGEFGASPLAKNANNYFGIKADKGWKGEKYNVMTSEYDKAGKLIPQKDNFRKYSSVEDSIKDYYSFLANNSRYKNAGVFAAPDYEEQAERLMKAGYAGAYNTKYATALKSLGKTISNTLSKFGEVVVAHKKEIATGGAIAVGAALVGLYFVYGRK